MIGTSSCEGEQDTTKKVFSTGEAAGICKISQQTIIRCFDSGKLEGFRVPGSRFRRIPRESLVKFMRENEIPLGMLEEVNRQKVLVVDDDPEIVELMVDVLEPAVVRITDGRNAELPTHVLAQSIPAPIGDIEGGIGEDEVHLEVL